MWRTSRICWFYVDKESGFMQPSWRKDKSVIAFYQSRPFETNSKQLFGCKPWPYWCTFPVILTRSFVQRNHVGAYGSCGYPYGSLQKHVDTWLWVVLMILHVCMVDCFKVCVYNCVYVLVGNETRKGIMREEERKRGRGRERRQLYIYRTPKSEFLRIFQRRSCVSSMGFLVTSF